MLQNCVKRIAHATEEITRIEAEIDRQAAANEDAKLLMSMTGIEAFTAMLLASEIGDITRFKTADRLVSWTGMCPRVYQSGNVMHHGHMKKASNRRVNWIMIQAANVAVRYDDRLNCFYQNARARHGGNHPIAITHRGKQDGKDHLEDADSQGTVRVAQRRPICQKAETYGEYPAVGARAGQSGLPGIGIFCNPAPSDSLKVARA